MAVRASLGRSPLLHLGRLLHPAALALRRQDSKAKVVWWLLEDFHEVKSAVQLRQQALVRQAAGMAAGTHWQGSCRAGVPQDPAIWEALAHLLHC